MRLRLQVRQTAENSFSWEQTVPVARIGRDPSCELSLQGEGTQSVSWNHARLELHADHVVVTDVGSSNGTYVNGKRIEGRTSLRLGDRIELGRTGPKLLVAQLELAAPPPPLATAFEARPAPAAAQAVAAGIPVAPAHVALPVDVLASRKEERSLTGGGTTRMLLRKLQTSQRRNMMLLGVAVASVAVLVLLTIGMLVALGVWSRLPPKAEVAQAEPARPLAGESTALKPEQIFQNTLPSTVWVVVPQARPDRVGFGSGSLVDRERRLVVTAQHVVGDRPSVTVFFPHYEDNKLHLKKKFYIENLRRLGIAGRIVARDVKRDLALIELDMVPPDTPVLPIADESPLPGQTVYSIGNPGLGDTDMWMLTTGSVRQCHLKEWAYADRAPRAAWVIETQSPVNPGDSGGPVVNGEGKLVAIVAGGQGNSQLMTFFIDRREIVDLLARTQ